MMASKRVRNKNFTEKEKAMLMELIMPHKNIIENIKVCLTTEVLTSNLNNLCIYISIYTNLCLIVNYKLLIIINIHFRLILLT